MSRAVDDHMSKSTPRSRETVQATLAHIDALDVDTLVLCLTEDIRPLPGAAGLVDWRLAGRLSRLIEKGVLTGAKDERVLTASDGMLPCERVLIFGFGPSRSLVEEGKERLAAIVPILNDLKAKRIAIDLPAPGTPLLPLVDEHLRKPLGDRLVVVFQPEEEAPRAE